MQNPRNKHLTYFQVENFKCFDRIELNDIGLINIITGDNNVGKSSLLEALLVNEDLSVFNEDLGIILLDKGFLLKEDKFNSPARRSNNFKSFLNTSSLSKPMKFLFSNIEYGSKILVQEISLYSDSLPPEVAIDPGIRRLDTMDGIVVSKTSYRFSEFPEFDITPYLSDQILFEDLVDFYENTLQKNFELKRRFLSFLNEFVPGVVNIEVRTAKEDFKEAHLVIYTNKSNYPIALNQYGQGTVKMLKIFMAVISFGKYRLMLDEVDNGIHFSRLVGYFKSIFNLAIENDTQLFITTHSFECLKSITQAVGDFNSAELKSGVRLFNIAKDKDQKVKAYKYDFNDFDLAINSEINIRGGVA